MSALETPVPSPAPETPSTSMPVAPPSPETSAPSPAPAPKAPLERRDLIKQAFDKPPRATHAQHQPRNTQGQFAGPPQTPAGPPTPAAPATPALTLERPAMPKSWNKELETYWNTAPPELLSRFIQREEESSRGVEPLKAAKTQLDELLNEFKPYEPLIRSEGGTPATVIRNLMQTAALFRTGTPQQKISAVANIMRQFNVPLDALQQAFTSQGVNAPTQPAQLDPQVQLLTQQVQQLTAQQQQAREAQLMSVVQKFASDPAHPHFEAVSERVLSLLSAPQVLGPDAATATEEEKLRLAYDMAIRMDPALHQQVQAEQQAADRARQQVAQAKQAAVQVSGAPAQGPPPPINPKDRRAFIANELKRAR